MQKVNVGILGSGDVGRMLAGGFMQLGHDVRVGTRDPEKLREWAAAAGDRATVGTFEEAARFGDILVLATLGTATESAMRMAGLANFDGKVVIDTTNPLDFSRGKPELTVGHTDSLGEQVQRLVHRRGALSRADVPGLGAPRNPHRQGDARVQDASRLTAGVTKSHWRSGR